MQSMVRAHVEHVHWGHMFVPPGPGVVFCVQVFGWTKFRGQTLATQTIVSGINPSLVLAFSSSFFFSKWTDSSFKKL